MRPQKSPDTPGSSEGNTEGPGTASSDHFFCINTPMHIHTNIHTRAHTHRKADPWFNNYNSETLWLTQA